MTRELSAFEQNTLDLFERLACNKCEYILENPLYLSCEHRFCKNCHDGIKCLTCNAEAPGPIQDQGFTEYIWKLTESSKYQDHLYLRFLMRSATFNAFKDNLMGVERRDDFDFNDDEIEQELQRGWQVPTRNEMFYRDEADLSQNRSTTSFTSLDEDINDEANDSNNNDAPNS